MRPSHDNFTLYTKPGSDPEANPEYESPRQHFVVLGGGTGIVPVLQGLRKYCFPDLERPLTDADKAKLTAIVTVADDGGSSGTLRRAYSILAPGDIRNCLSALAGDASPMHELFDFRFNKEVGEHSLGNLILTALSQLACDFPRAVEQAARILDVKGRVLPVTADNVALEAEYSDGTRICGESNISARNRRIHKIFLDPPMVRMLPQVSEAIRSASTIVIGPGSLYTSLLPILLVPGVADAIALSGATVVLVLNLMTEQGETDFYDPADFIYAFRRHVPQLRIHYILINNKAVPPSQRERYAAEGAHPITLEYSWENIDSFSRPINGDLLAQYDPDAGDERVRHDPDKLTKMITGLRSPAVPRKNIGPQAQYLHAG